MGNIPTDEELGSLPSRVEVDNIRLFLDIPIYMHLSVGPYHWYVAGYENGRLIGYALHDASRRLDWGEFHAENIREFRFGYGEVLHDPHWEATNVRDIDAIMEAHNHGRRRPP